MSEELREAIRDELVGWPLGSGYYATAVGPDDAGEMADALLSGPLAPLLAVLSTKQHNHTRFTNDSGATWSRCPASCPVALRRALAGPT